jgi:hypothetical protein
MDTKDEEIGVLIKALVGYNRELVNITLELDAAKAALADAEVALADTEAAFVDAKRAVAELRSITSMPDYEALFPVSAAHVRAVMEEPSKKRRSK